jgi:hypothetical protein
MTSLTSQQRKLVYLCGILILLIPIISLGLPASGKDSPGGTLTRLRTKYELGESDLGKVDPSGAAMNLVLLGMRGVAVNLLYTQFEKERDAKQWEEMRATTESIVRLQPHFEKVWEMNGWNLAYNTSAEWDAVEDRYYYVKVGGLFMKRGVEQNRKSTHLQYHVANVYQKKIGNADEAKYYRNYFLHDPDPKFENGPDPAFNPDIMDNYLVAKKEYIRACQIEDTEHRPQHILDRTLFRSMPARCQFDYAQVLQKDGKFGEVTREAWNEALSDWTTKYGQEVFSIPIGDLNNPVKFDIRLGMSRDDIKKEIANPDDVVRVTDMVDRYRKMVNYYYWTTRGTCESEQTTAEAHRSLYEASQKYKSQEFDKALELSFAGMTGFDKILHQPEYNELKSEDTLVEECLLGIRVWKGIQELGQLKIPNDYPLKWLEVEHQGNTQLQQNVERAYKRAFLTN